MTEASEQSNHICLNVVQLDSFWLCFAFTGRKQQGCLVIVLIEIPHNGQNKTPTAEQPVGAAVLIGVQPHPSVQGQFYVFFVLK